MKKKNKTYKIEDMVERSLHDISKVKDVSESIKEFNKIKYPEPKHYKSADIVKIRKRCHISQAVLAYVLNTKVTTVQKWERGVNSPSGPTSRLLQIVEKKGLESMRIA